MLCTQLCFRHWVYNGEQNTVPALMEFAFQRMQVVNKPVIYDIYCQAVVKDVRLISQDERIKNSK